MARKTPNQIFEKFRRNINSAQGDIRAGVNNVTENPMEKAAQQKDKYIANLNKAHQESKWERGLRRVSLDQWKKSMIEVGIGRISQGVDGAQQKIESFHRELATHQDAGQAQIAGMPDLTLEDSIQRMSAWARHMADFRRSE